MFCDTECKFKRWIIAPFFERKNCCPCYIDCLSKFLLCKTSLGPQLLNAILDNQFLFNARHGLFQLPKIEEVDGVIRRQLNKN